MPDLNSSIAWGCAYIHLPFLCRPAPRRLDDEELDSGDDQDRYDRTGDPMDYEQGDEGGYGETLNVMDLGLGRVPEPESQDGEVGGSFRYHLFY